MKWAIRPYNDKDYEQIASWWARRGQGEPLAGFLKPATCYVVQDELNGLLAAACFFRDPDMQVYGHLAGPCTNPDLPKHIRKEALQAVMQHIECKAKEEGITHLMMMGVNDKLTGIWNKMGYHVTMTGVSLCVREL